MAPSVHGPSTEPAVVKKVDLGNQAPAILPSRRGPSRAAAPTVQWQLRQGNCARDSHPGAPNGSRTRPPCSAGARTGLGRRIRLPSRCCAASAAPSCPEIAPQYVHTCFTRFLEQKKRERAKELGPCRNCSKPAIPGQSRCETCAEHHRQSRRGRDAHRSAAVNETAATQAYLA